MNFTYSKIPNEYAMNLMINGKRNKARSFLEYAFDISQNVKNSIRFYSESWSCTRHTSKKWIEDFNKEMSDFNQFWEAKNVSQKGYHEGTKRGTTQTTDNRELTDTFQPTAIQKGYQEVGQSNNINNIQDKYMYEFETIWKDYSLTFLKKQGRNGGDKQKALNKYLVLRKNNSHEKILSYIEAHKKLKIGHKNIQTFLTPALLKQWDEDSNYNPAPEKLTCEEISF